MSVLSVVPLVRESKIHAVCYVVNVCRCRSSSFLYSSFYAHFTITLERVCIEEELHLSRTNTVVCVASRVEQSCWLQTN